MQYQIGEFTLCTIDGVVKGAQGEFKIRPKTLQVLQYLIEHRERIATKREIIDTIWDDVVVQDQVLFQSIKELRDKATELHRKGELVDAARAKTAQLHSL